MTNLNKSKEQIIYELLISMNNGNNACYDDRLQYAIEQYEQLVEKGIVVEETTTTMYNNVEEKNKTDKKDVQITHDNYDILHNPRVKKLYPNLYKEVFEHDKISNSSWYELSSEAYEEYERYKNNCAIGYYEAKE